MLFLAIFLCMQTCVLSGTVKYKTKHDVIRKECGSFKAVEQLTHLVDFRIKDASALEEMGGMAALYKSTDSGSREHICGACLISNRHLLTAAHCVDGCNNTFSITLGNEKLDENPSTDPDTYPIQNIIVHPDFGRDKDKYGSSKDDYHDIAILITDRDVKYGPKIWPFCLPEKDQVYVHNKAVQIAGWGQVNQSHYATTIKSEFVKLVNNTQCELEWKKEAPDNFDRLIKLTYPQNFTNQILCAGRLGVDACKGDSGGPMMFENGKDVTTVIGIISKGVNCPEFPTLPGFYTNVAHYVDWITENTRNMCPEGFFSSKGSAQCFKLFAEVERTWLQAKQKCKNESLEIAKPTDSVAVALRKDLLERNGPMWVWLGAKGNGNKILWDQDDTELRAENELWYTGEPSHYVYSDYCLRLIVADYYNDLKPEQPYDVGPCPVKVNRYTLCEMTME